MKQLALLNANRRSNSSLRSSVAVLDGGGDGPIKSPAALFWLVLYGLCCLISLVLGFRFSRLVYFLLISPTWITNSPSTATTTIITAPFFRTSANLAGILSNQSPTAIMNPTNQTVGTGSRVVVGRHGILIRPWPHPNPEEVMRAHRILERVQKEQRVLALINLLSCKLIK